MKAGEYTGSAAMRSGGLSLHQLPQHGLEDAAVPVVLDLDRRVEARHRLEAQDRSVLAAGVNRHLLPRLERALDPGDVELLAADEAQALGAAAALVLERQHP